MARMVGSRRWLPAAGIAGLALLLSGSYCSWRNYYTPGAFAASTQTTVGPVAAFGSVWVNGTEFTDTSAQVTIDGVGALESQLAVGQVASLVGAVASSSQGSATSLAVVTKLVGPVSAVDLAAGSVTVLGQTVLVTGDTSVGAGVAPTDVGGILIGQRVAIDGYRTSTGVVASRFDLASLAQADRATGVVANLDAGAKTFTLNGTLVAYGSATSGLPAGVANGRYVIATGAALADAVTLQATSIITQNETPAGASGDSGSIHGAITSFGSATSFDVAGQPVTTTSSTSYTDGTSADLGPDVEVEVTGQYDGTGTLNATAVEIPPRATVRIVGPVTALSSGGQTLTVAGITIATNSHTRWDDRSATLLRTFTFANLNVGDWVEARGVATSSTQTATARVLQRETQPVTALVELQDAAAGVSAPDFTLTGVTVDASGANFTDVNGVSLTPATFFAEAAGRIVRARGTLSSTGALVASTVALRE